MTRYSARGFRQLGVNSDDDAEAFRALAAENGVDWPSIFDGGPGGSCARRWNVRGWPSSWLIDAEGVIRARDVDGPALDAWIERLLEERRR